MKFEKLDLRHKDILDKYNSMGDPLSSVQNFNALYTWTDALDFEIAVEDDVVYIFRNKPHFGFLPPLMNDKNKMPQAVLKIKEYCDEHDYEPKILDAEKWLIDVLDELNIPFKSIEDPDNSEYVYDAQRLMNLTGKKYHGKKNHYNNFIKNQKFELFDLKDTKNEAIEMNKLWLKGRESEYTLGELEGTKRALKNLDLLNLKGTTLFVDGVCVAFTISEDLKDNGVLVHVEKATDDINGAFTFINVENLKRNHKDALKVNREQDLGIEGLRKAKLSWKPIEMVDKYKITLL